MYALTSNRRLLSELARGLPWLCTLLLLAAPIHGRGQCAPSPAYADHLKQLPTQVSGFTLFQQEGLTYLELGCYPEARSSFAKALANADAETGEVKENLTALANMFLDLTSAYEAWRAGSSSEAKSLFLRCSDESVPPEVSVQATFALAEMLLQSRDDATWNLVEPNLKRLDEAGFWQARRYRFLYGLNSDNSSQRIADLYQRLEEETPVQTRLENEVILAEVLRLVGRVSEAALLVTDMDREFGRKAISPDLRGQYVLVCAGIASVQARKGDLAAAARYNRYLAARGDMYAPQ